MSNKRRNAKAYKEYLREMNKYREKQKLENENNNENLEQSNETIIEKQPDLTPAVRLQIQLNTIKMKEEEMKKIPDVIKEMDFSTEACIKTFEMYKKQVYDPKPVITEKVYFQMLPSHLKLKYTKEMIKQQRQMMDLKDKKATLKSVLDQMKNTVKAEN